MDINRAALLTPEVAAIVDDMFEYRKWSDKQHSSGAAVRVALRDAVKVIISQVPASADRSSAIRKLRDAHANCNSAITHGGKY